MPANDVKIEELDLNLRILDEIKPLRDEIDRLFRADGKREFIEYHEEIRFLFSKIEEALHRISVSVRDRITFPWQILVTSASNLTSGELHGTTKTQSVLTTASATATEFDWRDPKRTSRIVVGPGDGVEPHVFLVNHHYNGPAWRMNASGTWEQRNGIVIPYADGSALQLMFIRFDEADGYLPKPVNLGIGTTIYLEQRLSGDE